MMCNCLPFYDPASRTDHIGFDIIVVESVWRERQGTLERWWREIDDELHANVEEPLNLFFLSCWQAPFGRQRLDYTGSAAAKRRRRLHGASLSALVELHQMPGEVAGSSSSHAQCKTMCTVCSSTDTHDHKVIAAAAGAKFKEVQDMVAHTACG